MTDLPASYETRLLGGISCTSCFIGRAKPRCCSGSLLRLTQPSTFDDNHSPLAGCFLFWIRRLGTSGFFGGKGSGFGLGFELSAQIAHFEIR
jgi:hypothetical protein